MLGCQARGKKARNGAAHEIHIKRLEMKDDLGKRFDDVLWREDPLMMDGAEMQCDFASCGHIGSPFHSNGNRVEAPRVTPHERSDDAAVETTGEKCPNWDITHEPLFDGVVQRRSQSVAPEEDRLMLRLPVGNAVVLTEPDIGSEPSARWQFVDTICCRSKRLEFRGKHDRIIRLINIEGFDANGIASEKKLAAICDR